MSTCKMEGPEVTGIGSHGRSFPGVRNGYRRLGTGDPLVSIPPEHWERFEHGLFGFTVFHPPDWDALPGAMGAALLLLGPITEPVPFRANLVITIHPLPEGGLDIFVSDQQERSAVVLTDFRLVEEGAKSTGVRDRGHFAASYRQGRQTIELLQWNVSWGGSVVSTSAAAPSGEMDQLREVFDTIRRSLALPAEQETDG